VTASVREAPESPKERFVAYYDQVPRSLSGETPLEQVADRAAQALHQRPVIRYEIDSSHEPINQWRGILSVEQEWVFVALRPWHCEVATLTPGPLVKAVVDVLIRAGVILERQLRLFSGAAPARWWFSGDAQTREHLAATARTPGGWWAISGNRLLREVGNSWKGERALPTTHAQAFAMIGDEAWVSTGPELFRVRQGQAEQVPVELGPGQRPGLLSIAGTSSTDVWATGFLMNRVPVTYNPAGFAWRRTGGPLFRLVDGVMVQRNEPSEGDADVCLMGSDGSLWACGRDYVIRSDGRYCQFHRVNLPFPLLAIAEVEPGRAFMVGDGGAVIEWGSRAPIKHDWWTPTRFSADPKLVRLTEPRLSDGRLWIRARWSRGDYSRRAGQADLPGGALLAFDLQSSWQCFDLDGEPTEPSTPRFRYALQDGRFLDIA
jgi:hypothetical protein